MNAPFGYADFGEAVDGVDRLDGNLPVLVTGVTPASLTACGMGDLPMLMTPSHIRKALAPCAHGGHGISPSVLADLPGLLARPVAVWKSNISGRSCVLMDETDELGDPLVAVVSTGTGVDRGNRAIGIRRGSRVNFVLSVYGMTRAAGKVAAAASRGELLLLDRDRCESLRTRLPLRVDRAA